MCSSSAYIIAAFYLESLEKDLLYKTSRREWVTQNFQEKSKLRSYECIVFLKECMNSTWPSSSSTASHLSNMKKNCRSVCISLIANRLRNHFGCLPLLSCHTRMCCKLPSDRGQERMNVSTPPFWKTLRWGSSKSRGRDVSASPVMMIVTLAVVTRNTQLLWKS